MSNRKARSALGTLLKFLGLVVILTWSLLPIVWVLSTSIKNKVDAFALPPKLIFTPTLEHYASLFGQYNFAQFIRNSIIVGVTSSALAIVLGSMAAYSLSRMTFAKHEDVHFWILSTRMLPPVVVLIPFFIFWSSLRLMDTFVPLILMHTLMNLPLAIWIIKSFFDDLPREIEESSLIDGCTPLQAFWHVAVPLTRPGLMATASLLLLQSWNEFLFALTLTSSSTRTAAVSIAQFITPVGTKWGEITAASTLVMLPPLIFVVIMQRHLVRGLTMGAVK